MWEPGKKKKSRYLKGDPGERPPSLSSTPPVSYQRFFPSANSRQQLLTLPSTSSKRYSLAHYPTYRPPLLPTHSFSSKIHPRLHLFSKFLSTREKVQERERTSIETTSRLGRERERKCLLKKIYIEIFETLFLELYISPEKEGIIIRSDIFEFVSSSIPRKDVLQEERRSCLSSPIYSIYIRKGTVSFLPRLDEG